MYQINLSITTKRYAGHASGALVVGLAPSGTYYTQATVIMPNASRVWQSSVTDVMRPISAQEWLGFSPRKRAKLLDTARRLLARYTGKQNQMSLTLGMVANV